ncbi:MAG: 50S ribosomal protein L13 [Candidatus Fonsibacter sp.]|jgi:large subunit ribosomal protein L13
MTEFLKKKEIKKNWYKIDATGLIVGRLAAEISKILRGKHKTNYTPHMDCGDNVIVINADKVKFSGKKTIKKIYFKHTGYPGGIKETTPEKLLEKKPTDIIKFAVQRMLPKESPLARRQLTNLKIYVGEKHSHDNHKPVELDLKKRNRKNYIN